MAPIAAATGATKTPTKPTVSGTSMRVFPSLSFMSIRQYVPLVNDLLHLAEQGVPSNLELLPREGCECQVGHAGQFQPVPNERGQKVLIRPFPTDPLCRLLGRRQGRR